MESLVEQVENIESAAWSYVGIVVVAAIGLYLTIRTGVVQIRRIPDMFRSVTEKSQKDESGNTRSLSAFQAFTISASARVGTGNVGGVAGAIAMGGPGAVFWMWFMAIFTSAGSFVESTLAQVYKTKRFDTFKGGPAYYIQRGLGSRGLGIAFAVLFIFCFVLAFTSLQANTIVDAVQGATTSVAGEADRTWLTWILGLLLAGGTALIVIKGLRRVASVAQTLVPVMAILYILLGLAVVAMNFDQLPRVISLIFTEAFNVQSAAGGLFGAVIQAGIQRGMLSNEAGMGSEPNVAATADVSHPAKQGLVQTLGVYLDTLIICSVTAFIILVTFENPQDQNASVGADLTQSALETAFGPTGAVLLAMILFLLAFTSVLGNYSYGEANILFISSSERVRVVYAAALSVIVLLGSVAAVDLVWAIAGVTMVVIAVFNLIVIALLSNTALKVLKHYDRQRKAGVDPVFVSSDFPELQNVECWNEEDVQGFRPEPAGPAETPVQPDP